MAALEEVFSEQEPLGAAVSDHDALVSHDIAQAKGVAEVEVSQEAVKFDGDVRMDPCSKALAGLR